MLVIHIPPKIPTFSSISDGHRRTPPGVPSIAPPKSSSATASAFPQNLELWDVGAEVLSLQQFPNTHGYPVATTGPGSAGDETDFFGMKTYKALLNFQASDGLPATGFFGPLTRAALATMTASSAGSTSTAQ